MEIEDQTLQWCQALLNEADALSTERVWEEWKKWALRAAWPAKGLSLLRSSGWLSLYPELAAIIDVSQDPQWHPEGDVWIHTLHVCDQAAIIASRDQLSGDERMVLMFAALCHDLGKATTTEYIDGRWRAHGHCEAGVEPTIQFLSRIGCPDSVIEQVTPLVAEHLIHVNPEISPRTVRRLARRLGKASITQLVRLIEADLKGRPPLSGDLPEALTKIGQVAIDPHVETESPRPIIGGRHLIEIGHAPDRWFKEVLSACFEAQLEGTFDDEPGGLRFLDEILKKRLAE